MVKTPVRIRGFVDILKKSWSTIVYYVVGLYRRVSQDHVFLSAGGLAFSLFICIVPLVLILFSILGVVLENASIRQEIVSYIDEFVPYQQYADYAKEIILTRIDEFRFNRSIAGYFGVIGLLFAASMLFSSMRTILNRVFKIVGEKHLLIAKLLDFRMVLVVLAFFLFSMLSLPILEVLKDATGRIPILTVLQFDAVENVLFRIVSFLIAFVVFYTMYRMVPYGLMEKRVTAVSALCTTILWEIAKQVFGYYINNLANFQHIYGAYMFLIVLAFWIYYSAIIFIIGAEIGQLYRERRQERLT